jgi:hypothetical protein
VQTDKAGRDACKQAKSWLKRLARTARSVGNAGSPECVCSTPWEGETFKTVWPTGSDGSGPTLEFGYCDSAPLLFGT